MHICFLNSPIEYYSPVSGGALSTIIMQSAQGLLQRGHKVTVLTITNQDEVYSVGKVVSIAAPQRSDIAALPRKIAVLRSRIAGWDWPYWYFYLRSYSQALKNLSSSPDAIILFNDLVSAPYIKRILPQTKVFVWLQNEQNTSLKYLQPSIDSTTAFLTCSSYIKDWMAQQYKIPPEKLRVVNSGVDLENFLPRDNYLEPSCPLRTLFIGRIDPNKGPDIAIDALTTLQQEGHDIQLTVAGGLWFYGNENQMANPYFRSLKAKMEAVKAHYTGHITRHQVPNLIRQHDVAFVLSRSNEPFGLVVLEAMASGCAVIASDRGGLAEACGGAALLVDPDDLNAVIDNLRQLASDAELLKAQKSKSVERAARASWSVVADTLEQAIMLPVH